MLPVSTAYGTRGLTKDNFEVMPMARKRSSSRRSTATVKPRRKGQKPIRFKKGALRSQLGVKKGQKIPASKMSAARAGRYGKLAQKRARFKQNVLTGGRRRRR
jgi:hypothetical protein